MGPASYSTLRGQWEFQCFSDNCFKFFLLFLQGIRTSCQRNSSWCVRTWPLSNLEVIGWNCLSIRQEIYGQGGISCHFWHMFDFCRLNNSSFILSLLKILPFCSSFSPSLRGEIAQGILFYHLSPLECLWGGGNSSGIAFFHGGLLSYSKFTLEWCGNASD